MLHHHYRNSCVVNYLFIVVVVNVIIVIVVAQIPWPKYELQSGRPLRVSPLYERLAARGAQFGSKMGWERPNYFLPSSVSPSSIKCAPHTHTHTHVHTTHTAGNAHWHRRN
jgi:hypothetical protein